MIPVHSGTSFYISTGELQRTSVCMFAPALKDIHLKGLTCLTRALLLPVKSRLDVQTEDRCGNTAHVEVGPRLHTSHACCLDVNTFYLLGGTGESCMPRCTLEIELLDLGAGLNVVVMPLMSCLAYSMLYVKAAG